jgi:hypothetical protein
MEFIALLYGDDGQLLNSTGKTITFDLRPETYARFEQSAIQAGLQISAPAHREAYLRLGVHDMTFNRFGAVEIPIAQVSELPPAATVPAAAPAPVTAAPKP